MKPILRIAALACLAAGGLLVYFAGWLVFAEIVPAIADSGWSLQGDNLILNRNWQGNQLYLLVSIYLVAGASLVFGCTRLWRRTGTA